VSTRCLSERRHLTLKSWPLRQQVKILTKANDAQREEILRSHAELQDLKQRFQNLQTAHALVSNVEGKEKARRQINSLISKIDKTLELLNE